MKINKNLYALLLIIIFLITIVYFAMPIQEKEGFLPGVNILYNYQKRNLRFFKENFIDGSKEYVNRFLRKTGFY